MSSLAKYRAMVDAQLQQTIETDNWIKTVNQPQLSTEFLAPAQSLLAHGKRTRAAFLAAGWQLFVSDPRICRIYQ